MAVLPPDPVFTFRNLEMGPVNCICFHRAERLICGTSKGSIYLWDLQVGIWLLLMAKAELYFIYYFTLIQTNRVAHNFNISAEPVTTVQKHDETLYTQQKGGRIHSWSLSNTGYSLESSAETNHTGYCRIECIPERNLLLSPLNDNAIVVLDMLDLTKVIATLTPTTPDDATSNLGNVMCLKHIPVGDKDYVLGCYESGDFVTWDLAAGGKVVNSKRLEECPMAVDYDPATNRGVYGGPSDRLGVFSYQRNTMELVPKSDIVLKNPGVNCVKIRADRKVFSVGGWDGRIRIYSWNSLRPLAVLTDHKAAVSDIAHSLGSVSLWNSPIMGVAGLDGHVSLWDLYN